MSNIRQGFCLVVLMLIGGCASGDQLYRAIRQGDVEETARLLENGADTRATVPSSVRSGEFGTVHFENDGDTMLIAALRSPMNAEVRPGLVRLLLQYGAKVNAADATGRTPLMWAAFVGDVHVLAILIENKASVSRTDSNRRTCLHYAVLEPATDDRMESVCLMLLDAGADPLAFDYNRQTALDMLLERGSGQPAYRNRRVEDILRRAMANTKAGQD